jgi:hypothetical protein
MVHLVINGHQMIEMTPPLFPPPTETKKEWKEKQQQE